MKYKIINLVREDFNKSIIFYNVSSETVKEYFKKLYDWLSKNTESDLYANFKKNDNGKIILKTNMACIDMLVDNNWWSNSDLEKVFDEIV